MEGTGQTSSADQAPLALAHQAVDAGLRRLESLTAAQTRARPKGTADVVTDADLAVEEAVGQVLRSREPALPVLGEESWRGGEVPAEGWLLDPVDGTVNFVHGSPFYAISLGLVASGEPVAGVVHAPALGRRWAAAPAAGPSLDRPVPPAPAPAVAAADAIIAVSGLGTLAAPATERLLARLQHGTFRLRMSGAMSLDLVGTAHGWQDASICAHPHPWDVAAGVPILRDVGKVALGDDGRDFRWDSPVLVAGPRPLAEELLALWHQVCPATGGAGEAG